MAQNITKDLSDRLSKRLANFKLPNDVVSKLADRITIDGLSIGRFNPCIYGICIDYFTNKLPSVEGILNKGGISRVDVFPYGIINPEWFHVQVGFSVDELQGHGITGGFGL